MEGERAPRVCVRRATDVKEKKQTYGDSTEAVHDAHGGDLSRLPLRGLYLIVVWVVVREQGLRDGTDVVDV